MPAGLEVDDPSLAGSVAKEAVEQVPGPELPHYPRYSLVVVA